MSLSSILIVLTTLVSASGAEDPESWYERVNRPVMNPPSVEQMPGGEPVGPSAEYADTVPAEVSDENAAESSEENSEEYIAEDAEEGSEPSEDEMEVQGSAAYLRADGTRILDSTGRSVLLRGPSLEITDKTTFTALAPAGANAVRGLIDYRLIWDEVEPGAFRQSGFDVLDALIESAARQDLRVVLCLKSWPGVPDAATSDAESWKNPGNLDRVIAFWKELATRYSNKPTIAAYELMHDPEPPSTTEYSRFMQVLVDRVREIDPNHLLIIDEPAVGDGWFDFPEVAPLIVGANIAYGILEDDPVLFTRQGSSFRERHIGVGLTWPGRSISEVRLIGSGGVQSIQGTHDWKTLKLEAISPQRAEHVAPRLFVKGGGRARFENIVLEEIVVFGRRENRILFADTFASFRDNFEPEGWWAEPWDARLSRIRSEEPTSGMMLIVGNGRLVTAQPFTDKNFHRIPAAGPDRRYRLTASVEAEGVDEAGIAMEFLGARQATTDTRNLQERFLAIESWSRAAKAPLVVFDFAVTPNALDRGGRDWLNAVYAIAERKGISWFSQVVLDDDARARRTAWEVLRVFLEPFARPRAQDVEEASPLKQPKTPRWDRITSLKPQPARQLGADEPKPETPELSPAVSSPPSTPPPIRKIGGVLSNPVPPPPDGCWVGAHCPEFPADAYSATTFSSVMQFMRRVRKMPAWVHVYVGWTTPQGSWSEFPEETFREILASAATPVVTWDPFISPKIAIRQSSLPYILEGHADTYIRSWADSARRFRDPLVIRLVAESDAAVTIFRKVVDIFDQRGATNVSWMWSPSALTVTDTQTRAKIQWPGESYVDWIGLSLFGMPDAGGDTVGFSGKQFGSAVRSYAGLGKPVCLAELACASVEKQSVWWSEVLDAIRSMEWADIQSVILTETSRHWQLAPVDLKLRSDAAHAAGRQLASPFFKGADQR